MSVPVTKNLISMLFSKTLLGVEEEYRLNISYNITQIIFYEIIIIVFKFYTICLHFKIQFYLFIGYAGSLLLCGLFSSCGEWGPLSTVVCGLLIAHSGFSCWGAHALGHTSFSTCSKWVCAWAQLFCSMWDPPKPGIEPTSSALAGGFFTTKPPGKTLSTFYNPRTASSCSASA